MKDMKTAEGLKTYSLNGVFTTVTDYAKTNNLTRRGVLVRINSKRFPYEVTQVGKLLLIKLS